MFEIDIFFKNVTNPLIADSDGGTYWVGQVVMTAEKKSRPRGYSKAFAAASAAGCSAAYAVETYERTEPLLYKLLMAEAIRQAVGLHDIARQTGVTYGYLNQLRNGIRRLDQISDEFSQNIASVLGLPRLLVLYLAGRLTDNDLAELDSAGAKFSSHLTDLASIALQLADEVVASAKKRVEEEERRVAPQRRLTADEAQRLLSAAEDEAKRFRDFAPSLSELDGLLTKLRAVAEKEQVGLA